MHGDRARRIPHHGGARIVNRDLDSMITMDFPTAKVTPATGAEALYKTLGPTSTRPGRTSARAGRSDFDLRSALGGVAWVTLDGDRVQLAGRAVTVLSDPLHISPPNSH
jgi:hypothetical protein